MIKFKKNLLLDRNGRIRGRKKYFGTVISLVGGWGGRIRGVVVIEGVLYIKTKGKMVGTFQNSQW